MFRILLPPSRRGDFVNLAMLLVCLFVMFVASPIIFIRRTPNMKSYLEHKLKAWKDKFWIVKKLFNAKKNIFDIFRTKNKVAPQEISMPNHPNA
jgi:hypothetical protein